MDSEQTLDRPFFTDDGRYVFASTNPSSGVESQIVAVGVEDGHPVAVDCRCVDVVPAGGSTVAAFDDRNRLLLFDLDRPSPMVVTPTTGGESGYTYRLLAGVGGKLLMARQSPDARDWLLLLDATGTAQRLDIAVHGGLNHAVATANAAGGLGSAIALGHTADNAPSQPCAAAAVSLLDPISGAFMQMAPVPTTPEYRSTVDELWWGGDGHLYVKLRSDRCTTQADGNASVEEDTSGAVISWWRLDGRNWTRLDIHSDVQWIRQLDASTQVLSDPMRSVVLLTAYRSTRLSAPLMARTWQIAMPPARSADRSLALRAERLSCSPQRFSAQTPNYMAGADVAALTCAGGYAHVRFVDEDERYRDVLFAAGGMGWYVRAVGTAVAGGLRTEDIAYFGLDGEEVFTRFPDLRAESAPPRAVDVAPLVGQWVESPSASSNELSGELVVSEDGTGRLNNTVRLASGTASYETRLRLVATTHNTALAEILDSEDPQISRGSYLQIIYETERLFLRKPDGLVDLWNRQS